MRIAIAAAVIGSAVALAGCSSGPADDTVPSPAAQAPATTTAPATTGPPDPHAAFNPCTALTKDWLKRNGFISEAKPQPSFKSGDIERQGCAFEQADERYDMTVHTARNDTLDNIRTQNYVDVREFNANGRKALTYRISQRRPQNCRAAVEMKGGLLAITLNKYDFRNKIPAADPCTLVQDVSKLVAAEVPASA